MEFDIEMPTPCQHCGIIFDLHDGTASELWYPNTIICDSCGNIEEREIEVRDEIANLHNEIEDAEWTIKNSNLELDENLKKLLKLEKEKDNVYRIHN
jgi:hypothetical protein